MPNKYAIHNIYKRSDGKLTITCEHIKLPDNSLIELISKDTCFLCLVEEVEMINSNVMCLECTMKEFPTEELNNYKQLLYFGHLKTQTNE